MMAPEELGRLIDAQAAALTLYARQWCAAPEDVVQDAFVRLAGMRPPPSHVVPWLFAVVRNAAISAARSERRRRQRESVVAARTPGWFVPSERGPLDAEAATKALAALPADEREAIVAHLWGGLSFDDVGKLIGVSAATAHRRYVAGLESLRSKLGDPCPPKTQTQN